MINIDICRPVAERVRNQNRDVYNGYADWY